MIKLTKSMEGGILTLSNHEASKKKIIKKGFKKLRC